MSQQLTQGNMHGEELLSLFVQSFLRDQPDLVFVKNADLVYVGASQSFSKMVGIDNPEQIVGKVDTDLFSDADLVRRYNYDDRRLLESGKPLIEYIEPSTAGNVRGYYRTSKLPMFDKNGQVIGLYGISRNITLEYEAKLSYERELNSLLELPPNTLLAGLFDITNWKLVDLKQVNAVLQDVDSDASIERYIELAINSVANDDMVRDFYRSLSQEVMRTMFESGKRSTSLEYQRCMSDGSVHWVRASIHFLLDPVNGNLCAVSVLTDIDEEKTMEQARTRAAEWDALTNVYNREATMTHIRHFLAGEGAANTHWLFMVDVDNFKMVNDLFGHIVGDETLVDIAAAMRRIFREEDIVGRIGGDEFFVLMKNAAERSTAVRRARELVEALQYVCKKQDDKVELSGSVGISRYAGEGKTLEQLYAEADVALYRAKRAGKNRFMFAEETGEANDFDVVDVQIPTSTVHLPTLLENMDAVMFQTELSVDGELRVTYSSHNLFRSSKSSDTTAHDENIWAVVLPEDLKLLQEAILKAVHEGAPLDHTCRICNGDGRIEWRYIRGTHLPDDGDGVCRMIHVATDVTRQKKIEAELREKDSIIDFAMRNTDVNLWYFDYETAECQLTKSCQRVHEMPGVEKLVNFPECLFDINYVREDCIELLRNAYEKLRKTGETTVFDVWFRKADGTGWWCERDMLSPLLGADGRVTRGIGIGKNVTAEKEMEEKFHTFQSYRSMAQKNTLASVRMNLTTDWCGDFASDDSAILKLEHEETVDSFFQVNFCNIASFEDFAAVTYLSRMYLLDAFARGETSLSFEYRYRLSGGNIIWLRTAIDMMKNPTTGDVEALYYTFDIDYEKNMNLVVDRLISADYEFMGLIDVTTRRIMVFGGDVESPLIAKNDGLYMEEMPRVLRYLLADEYYEEAVRCMGLKNMLRELENKEFYSCSFPARDLAHIAGGRKQWKFSHLDQSHTKILMTRSDITSIYTAERDALTGLYNRETFYRKTRAVLDNTLDRPFFLIRFDIDCFKAYNDACGVQAGDHVLAQLGCFVRETPAPEPSVFGRIEADHFVFLVPADEFDMVDWMQRHIRFFEDVAPGYRFVSSVGIYEVTERGMDISLMCDKALLALRTVKASYTHKLAWYDKSMRDRLMRDQSLEDEMEHALLDEQFVVYFQQLMNYETGAIIGAEALVRWIHPKHGLIPPNEFIPLFEKNGFVLKLDAYVWEKSCAYLRKWLDRAGTPCAVPVSVNISRRDLYDPELCDRLRAMVEKYHLPFSMLKLEITETAYMDDPGQLIGVVNRMRAIGFTVEMDDFGSGYSSLNMLKDVPVDILKLDTRFLSESEDNERAIIILDSVIRMAQALGLSVIAEGVETKMQADHLESLSCYQMQGYYFGRPMPAEAFEQLLIARL